MPQYIAIGDDTDGLIVVTPGVPKNVTTFRAMPPRGGARPSVNIVKTTNGVVNIGERILEEGP